MTRINPTHDYEIISRESVFLFFRVKFYVIKRIRHWSHLEDDIHFYDHEYESFSSICWKRDLSGATHFINYNKVCRILNKFVHPSQLPGWDYEVVFSTNETRYQIEDPLEKKFERLECLNEYE